MKSETLFLRTLEEALELWRKLKPQLYEDPYLVRLLEDLREALAETERLYRETGAYRLCAECAARGEPTCCGRDMELHVSRELLLINLSLGARLPERRAFPSGCFFLSLKGCSLPARPLLCRNFFCPWFRERFPAEKLTLLTAAQEPEARTLFLLEDYLRTLLQKNLPHP
ncbi:MAG TPA: hypothetical protein ENJ40_00965 [Thermosulfurimonas dismutans]|uniref:Uncharacterized protein n=1 Tax=Thermosulfurimonas dismutans TaxID=999894 RepID=A0A7C3CLQ5_9BACT|nr:hypothetical protein [Thermosulfurimonas dismutans]